MRQERTWKDVVIDALQRLGGEAHLLDITDAVREDPKAIASDNQFIKEKVRQVVRAYKVFETTKERSGIYRLIDETPIPTITKPEITKAITDEIQGKLLYIGRANNYETFAPSYDCTKRQFDGKPLAELVTIRENLADIPRLSNSERKRMADIDVMWFAEIKGEFRPRFAFEIEHKSPVITGLERLSVIPDLFQTRLFIVGKDNKKVKQFEKYLSAPTFKGQADRFGFKYFEEIREIFTYAQEFVTAREKNSLAMQQAGLD